MQNDKDIGHETRNSHLEQKEKMVTFGRTFKSPIHFARARRPGMPGRTLSNSSDMSATSVHEKSQLDAIAFPSTPLGENHTNPQAVGSAHSVPTVQPLNDDSASAPATTIRSRPIAIEVPKFHSAPERTPPEPLSARGDVPGGYFPLHEDPNVQVRRPHPLHPSGKRNRHQFHLSLDLPPKVNEHEPSANLATMPESAVDTGNSTSHMPVASYLPSGAPDTLLPMGKYYPSNYEMWNRSPHHQGRGQPTPRSTALTGLASTKSDSQVPTRSADPSRHDSDVKRMLQQYQRDMITQARLAANEVLSGVSTPSQDPAAVSALNGAPLNTLQQLGGSSAQKPMAPKLLPLGSPGPVTPMDLEEGEGGGYLERGNLGSSPLGDGEQVSRALLAEENRITKDSAPSSLVDAGPASI